MPETKAARQRAAAVRTARGLDQVWENRKSLVKTEMAAENAANDAKTARLRALRLEKEALEAEAARNAPPPEPKTRKRKV
jgi:hypothetical protein